MTRTSKLSQKLNSDFITQVTGLVFSKQNFLFVGRIRIVGFVIRRRVRRQGRRRRSSQEGERVGRENATKTRSKLTRFEHNKRCRKTMIFTRFELKKEAKNVAN
jgi:hypothetical protein